ncbi:hypothetical protein HOD29_00755 [archaeon]|jgi:hypothetical protein|nr:hypothetical protein [archaeon]
MVGNIDYDILREKYRGIFDNEEVNVIAYWVPSSLGENYSLTEEEYLENAKKQINSGLAKKIKSALE